MLYFDNLLKSRPMLWSTKSKAFRKSHKSIANWAMWIQVWRMAMRACVVDFDLRQPNWQLSRCGSMKKRNHLPTIIRLTQGWGSDIGVRVQVYSSLCHLNLQSRNPIPIPFARRRTICDRLSIVRTERTRYESYLVKSGNSSTLFD